MERREDKEETFQRPKCTFFTVTLSAKLGLLVSDQSHAEQQGL